MSQFSIGAVKAVLDDNQIIEVESSGEIRCRAFPLFTVQGLRVEDEVLLIKVSEDTDTYMYLPLRLDNKMFFEYYGMMMGFVNKNTIGLKADNIEITGRSVILKGNISVAGNSDSTVVLNGTTAKVNRKGDDQPGPFNCIDICPYTGKRHSTNKVYIK